MKDIKGAATRSRKPRMHRVPDAEPLSITPSRRRILELVARLRYLTPTLLGKAYGAGKGRGMKHVANELGRLYHNNYLARHVNPTRLAGEGSDAFVYSLAPDGGRVVLSPEEWSERRHSIYRRAEGKRNYEHALLVACVQVILELGAARWTIDEFVSDHEDQSTKTTVEIPGKGRRTIWPDAEAIVRLPRGDRLLYLFEVDHVRRSYRRVEERFESYALHASGESLARLTRKRGVAGVVVVFAGPFDVPNYYRLDDSVGRAHDVVARLTTARSRPQFLFWNTEAWWRDDWREPRGQELSAVDEVATVLRLPREPRKILAEKNVFDLKGQWRRLVEAES